MRCTATKVNGQPCTQAARWDGELCPSHARTANAVPPAPIEVIAARIAALQAERDEAEATAGDALARANRASRELVALARERRQLAAS